jgi:hypothetical protein
VGYQLNWIRERHNAPIFHGISQDMIVTPDGGYRLVVMPQDAPWPLGWFGESGETVLGVEDGLPKAEIERIRRLFPEADADIEFIAREDIDPAYRR